MSKKSSRRAKATVFILLACAFVLSSVQPPQVAAEVTISSIEPESGLVGETITINATIDTENGFYIVRWDNTLNVTTGYALGYTVITSFTVPQTAGLPQGRNIPVEVIDDTTQDTDSTAFTLNTGYYVKAVTPMPPLQLQEGATTDIWANITGGEPDSSFAANVTVEDPANNTYSILTTLNTSTAGYGEEYITYPTDFGVGAHTNYTGTYTVTFNETLAPVYEFSVGLTNATEYVLFQTVNIRAANYTYPGEHAWVNITYNQETIFSQNVTQIDSLIETDWAIPVDTPIGTYNITVTNSTTPGTRKPVNDTQQFIVEKPTFIVHIEAENLNGEPVSQEIMVETYNGTRLVKARPTNATGVATFSLKMANYTFRAIWRQYVEVGVLPNQSIMEDKVGNKALALPCNLTNIRMLVVDEAGTSMPFISLTLNYSYYTRAGALYNESLTYTTNFTGIWKLHSMLTNFSYIIEAQRYGHIFHQTYIEKMAVSPWFNITITLPTQTASILVVDSKENVAEGFRVEAHEWSKGTGQPDQSHTTNSEGIVSFSLPFGKYRIRAYKGSILLNETAIDFIRNQSFVFHLATLNVDLTVTAVGYLGQPIPNALVRVEQKITAESVERTTGSDGQVTFKPLSFLGGDLRVSVYIGGELSETRDLYLTNSKQVTFYLNRYVAVAGYVMETRQFVTAIAIGVLIAAFIVGLTYKRLSKALRRNK